MTTSAEKATYITQILNSSSSTNSINCDLEEVPKLKAGQKLLVYNPNDNTTYTEVFPFRLFSKVPKTQESTSIKYTIIQKETLWAIKSIIDKVPKSAYGKALDKWGLIIANLLRSWKFGHRNPILGGLIITTSVILASILIAMATLEIIPLFTSWWTIIPVFISFLTFGFGTTSILLLGYTVDSLRDFHDEELKNM